MQDFLDDHRHSLKNDEHTIAVSSKPEDRLRDALDQGILREFPNPERLDCPPPELIRQIALHQVSFAQAEPWLEHVTSCSPCFREYSAYAIRRKRTILAVAACFLIVAAVTGWMLITSSHNRQIARPVAPLTGTQEAAIQVLDLRARSRTRGGTNEQAERPLGITLPVSRLTIYLPLGSSDGPYDIRIATREGTPLINSAAQATLKEGVTALTVSIDFSSVVPGEYLLQIRKPSFEWTSFQLQVR
jgi:hypothetical protein